MLSERGSTPPHAAAKRQPALRHGFLLRALTQDLGRTYAAINPSFCYDSSRKPRRVLTKPGKAVANEGQDNAHGDLVVHVSQTLASDSGHKYEVEDLQGHGAFGHVYRCRRLTDGSACAVKVVKNKTAYFNQALQEIHILQLLNKEQKERGGEEEELVVHLREYFVCRRHLCLVFELLGCNLFELLRQRRYHGLPLSAVRSISAQLLRALELLGEKGVVHCDLKPENVLLANNGSTRIKLIDLGSAVRVRDTGPSQRQLRQTYVQSRFYRAPEVLLGQTFDRAIDMWSFACVCAELYLGIPLFPGESEFHQMLRICRLRGVPPRHMLDRGRMTRCFFHRRPSGGHTHSPPSGSSAAAGHGANVDGAAVPSAPGGGGTHEYVLKTTADFEEERARAREAARAQQHAAHQLNGAGTGSAGGGGHAGAGDAGAAASDGRASRADRPVAMKEYFAHHTVMDIILNYRSTQQHAGADGGGGEADGDEADRRTLGHFVEGILNFDPAVRWEPGQAMAHPFIRGEVLAPGAEFVPRPRRAPPGKRPAISPADAVPSAPSATSAAAPAASTAASTAASASSSPSPPSSGLSSPPVQLATTKSYGGGVPSSDANAMGVHAGVLGAGAARAPAVRASASLRRSNVAVTRADGSMAYPGAFASGQVSRAISDLGPDAPRGAQPPPIAACGSQGSDAGISRMQDAAHTPGTTPYLRQLAQHGSAYVDAAAPSTPGMPAGPGHAARCAMDNQALQLQSTNDLVGLGSREGVAAGDDSDGRAISVGSMRQGIGEAHSQAQAQAQADAASGGEGTATVAQEAAVTGAMRPPPAAAQQPAQPRPHHRFKSCNLVAMGHRGPPGSRGEDAGLAGWAGTCAGATPACYKYAAAAATASARMVCGASGLRLSTSSISSATIDEGSVPRLSADADASVAASGDGPGGGGGADGGGGTATGPSLCQSGGASRQRQGIADGSPSQADLSRLPTASTGAGPAKLASGPAVRVSGGEAAPAGVTGMAPSTAKVAAEWIEFGPGSLTAPVSKQTSREHCRASMHTASDPGATGDADAEVTPTTSGTTAGGGMARGGIVSGGDGDGRRDPNLSASKMLSLASIRRSIQSIRFQQRSGS